MLRYTAAAAAAAGVPLQCLLYLHSSVLTAATTLTSPKVTDCSVLPAAAAAAAHLASRHTAHSLHHDNQVLSCSSLLTRLSTHQEAGAAPERDHLLWWLDSAETEHLY